MPANTKNKKMAIEYINSLQAGGGTEAAPPLKSAMYMKSDDTKLKMIVFITDGSLGHEQHLLINNSIGPTSDFHRKDNNRFASKGILHPLRFLPFATKGILYLLCSFCHIFIFCNKNLFTLNSFISV